MKEVLSRSLAFLFASAVFTGCSFSSPGYPVVDHSEAKTSKQVCHQCGKVIESIDALNRLQLGAAEYFVCGEACREEQRAWHEEHFGMAR